MYGIHPISLTGFQVSKFYVRCTPSSLYYISIIFLRIFLTMSQHQDQDELQKQAELRCMIGRAHWTVLYCQQCHSSTLPSISNLTQHFDYSWAITVTCSACNEQWNICTHCDSARTPMVDKFALYNHYYKKHRKKTTTSDQNVLIHCHHKVDELKKQAELRGVTGRAPVSVLYCQNCHPKQLPSISNVMQHFQYPWAVTVMCSTCNERWNVCTQCPSVRKPFLDNLSLYNHYYRKHRGLNTRGATNANNPLPATVNEETLCRKDNINRV